jgi:hypothetical protein
MFRPSPACSKLLSRPTLHRTKSRALETLASLLNEAEDVDEIRFSRLLVDATQAQDPRCAAAARALLASTTRKFSGA